MKLFLRTALLLAAAALLPACDKEGDTTIVNTLTGSAPASGTILALVSQGANNFLVNVSPADPGTPLRTVAVTGVGGTLFGLDYRPANGQLYTITSSNELYSIDPASGIAIKVGTGNLPLAASVFGFDFNPVADRLRLVDNTQDNFRINPNNGLVAAQDTDLAYAGGDPNSGQTPNVTACAYTNSVAGALTTTLYGIDRTLNILVIQNPPNLGTLNTVGSLGVTVHLSHDAGFDISPSGLAYAAFVQDDADDVAKLFSINLATGAATLIGTLGTGAPIRGFAIVP